MPFACLGLPSPFPLHLKGIRTFLHPGTQKAIKFNEFTFADLLDYILGWCGQACREWGDQELLEAARPAVATTAAVSTSRPPRGGGGGRGAAAAARAAAWARIGRSIPVLTFPTAVPP